MYEINVNNKDIAIKEKIFCNKCNVNTIHKCLASISKISRHDPYEAPTFYYYYETLICAGCETISFRSRYTHSEMLNIRLNNNPYDKYNDTIETQVYEDTYFPEHIKTNPKILESNTIPKLIKELYNETLSLVSKKMFRFAALGLRIIIEELSNQLGAREYNLKDKIDGLQKIGKISDSEKEVLVTLKEFGNDAAHKNFARNNSDFLYR
jgi:hypothetical protein